MSAHDASTTAPRAAPRACERAFTLVELIVGMLIVLVLMGISIYGVMGARKSGRMISTIAAAHAYANAAESFAREHRGRFPRSPGAAGGADWAASPAAELERGPKSDRLGTTRYYLNSVPESVQDGSVTFGAAGAARLDYAATGPAATPTGFVLTVTVEGSDPCAVLGGAATSSLEPCSRR